VQKIYIIGYVVNLVNNVQVVDLQLGCVLLQYVPNRDKHAWDNRNKSRKLLDMCSVTCVGCTTFQPREALICIFTVDFTS
jgi:hypothetical protein